MRVGVATIAAGRPEHLRRQAAAVAGLGRLERYVVVVMDGADAHLPGATMVPLPASSGQLPLAAARNRAIAALGDVDLAVVLDVDCIPGPELVERYRDAAIALADAPALLCGPVGYLDPLDSHMVAPSEAERAAARRRVIRSFPATGVAAEPSHELFWSLSFAVAPAVHRGIGGFDERYVGYGAEDTDYGLAAREAGVGLWMVAGAWAYHQHHPPSPPRHVASITANARRFHARWATWPMPDRLAQFAAAGLIRWDPDAGVCETRTSAGEPA